MLQRIASLFCNEGKSCRCIYKFSFALLRVCLVRIVGNLCLLFLGCGCRGAGFVLVLCLGVARVWCFGEGIVRVGEGA